MQRGQFIAALYGVWLLLKLDPRAFDFFEKTPGGFARSFLPALLLSPLHILQEVLAYSPNGTKLAFMPFMVVQILWDVLSWVAFPFAMIYITRLLARETRYFHYMVPYNWFQLPLGLVLFPVQVLATLGLVSGSFAGFVILFGWMLLFTFGSFIARNGLQIGVMTSIAVVVFDFVLTILIGQIVSRIWT